MSDACQLPGKDDDQKTGEDPDNDTDNTHKK